MNRLFAIMFLILPALWMGASAYAQGNATKPNIVHIFVDDLGFGSVGFNGQQLIKTPNLDALAAGGMNFTNAYAAPLCAASRGMLMSGFHSGHGRIDRNQDINGDVFAADDVTVADTLLKAGYHTSLFGKNGFGGTGGTNPQADGQGTNPVVDGPNSVPSRLGYKTFYGYLDHSRAHNYFPSSLWESNQLDVDPVLSPTGNTQANPHVAFAHELVADRAVGYLTQKAKAQNAGNGDPFYSQINFTIPHANVDDVSFIGTNRYADKNWTNHQRNYAELVSRMDDSVGEIMDALRDPNGDGDTSDSVLDNTLIIFTSDNGPTRQSTNLATINFFEAAGGFRGTKRDLYEGGIHVPGVAYWEGTIKPGSTSDRYTDLTDFMPTAADLAGVDAPVGVDGVSIAPLLTGQGIQRQRDYLIFEHHEGGGEQPNSQRSIWAIVHTNGYKLIRHASGSDELFNLNTDPGEGAPLDLTTGGNQAIYDELLAIALAEGVESDRHNTNANVASYRTWTGNANNGKVSDANNWSGSGAPEGTWSAVIDNPTGKARTANVAGNVSTLGFEVRGSGAVQTVNVANGVTLIGRNEIRIANGGHLHLDHGNLKTVRWVDVDQGGELSGDGNITGDLYALGRVAPGLVGADPDRVGVDTGLVSAVVFDFNGVQDDSPLKATSTLSKFIEGTPELAYGAGAQPHDAAQAGDEYNMRGFNGKSLAEAITGNDYVGYTIAPVSGIEAQLGTASFNVWRNGANAATDYAVLTSEKGFIADQALGATTINDAGSNNQHTIKGVATGGWSADPVEVRLYGWNANHHGNTHLNAVALTASFRSAPGARVTVPGILTIEGDYFHLDSATLAIDLTGNSNTDINAPEYDQLTVSGLAALAGNLDVSLKEGYVPVLGESFNVLSAAGSLQGTFATVQGVQGQSGLAANQGLAVTYDQHARQVRVTTAFLGDADLNNKVEFEDFNTLANHFNGPSTGKHWVNGDFDGDGDVTFNDFNVLANNFGIDAAATVAKGLAGEPVANARVAASEVKLLIGSDGSLTIEGGDVELNGYSITSAGNMLISDGDDNASPFAFYLANDAGQITAGNIGATVNINGQLALDAAIAAGDIGIQDLVFEYGTSSGTFQGVVEVVPEPSTTALISFGALLLSRRCR